MSNTLKRFKLEFNGRPERGETVSIICSLFFWYESKEDALDQAMLIRGYFLNAHRYQIVYFSIIEQKEDEEL